MEKMNNESKITDNDPIDPMTFMTPDQVAEDDKKVEIFIKAFRFGAPNFFNKIKEVYEAEGIKGLNRLEMSLDNYMNIRNLVVTEVMANSQSDDDEYGFDCTEAGEEDCVD